MLELGVPHVRHGLAIFQCSSVQTSILGTSSLFPSRKSSWLVSQSGRNIITKWGYNGVVSPFFDAYMVLSPFHYTGWWIGVPAVYCRNPNILSNMSPYNHQSTVLYQLHPHRFGGQDLCKSLLNVQLWMKFNNQEGFSIIAAYSPMFMMVGMLKCL